MAARTDQLHVIAFDAPGLGDRSYLVHDGSVGAVIDAQRDTAPYLGTAAGLGIEIVLVLETHIHNDYVSGGLSLARRTGAAYGVPAGEQVDFAAECDALDEGAVRSVGGLRLTVLATPGHTPHHLSYLFGDGQGHDVVLTGGSLLAGATGRTDLLGADLAAELAAAQWRSVRRLLDELPPATVVLPTHGFGSFCSAGAGPQGPAGELTLTIATERRHNPAARLELGAFVDSLRNDALPVPAYYRHMAPLNRAERAGTGGGHGSCTCAGAGFAERARRRRRNPGRYPGAPGFRPGPPAARSTSSSVRASLSMWAGSSRLRPLWPWCRRTSRR